MEDNMTRWELLTLLLSIKGLLETDNTAKALEVIDNVIAEAKRNNAWNAEVLQNIKIYIAILEAERDQLKNGNIMYDFDEFAARTRKKYGIK